MAAPDTWTEMAYISIAAKGYKDLDFSTVTSSIDIDEGDKEFDSIPNMRGGRLIVDKAQEPTMVTFEMYPTSVHSNAYEKYGDGVSDYFHGRNFTNIDTCTVADWTESTDAIADALNTTTYLHNGTSLSLGKDGSTSTGISYLKTITSASIANHTLRLDVYVADATTLTALDVSSDSTCYIRLGSGSDLTDDYDQFDFADRLAVGWNHLEFDLASSDSEGSSAANFAAITKLGIYFTTDATGTTFASGKVIMDKWRSRDETEPFDVVVSSRRRELYRVAMLWTDDVIATGTVGASPSNTIIATSGLTSDEEIGKLFRLTSGTAIGNVYLITDNAATTITCAGGTMEDDGVLADDTYEIVNTGRGAVPSGENGIRWYGKEGRLVSCKKSFTDGVLKYTIKFKFNTFNKSGTGEMVEDSTDETAVMSDLGVYY